MWSHFVIKLSSIKNGKSISFLRVNIQKNYEKLNFLKDNTQKTHLSIDLEGGNSKKWSDIIFNIWSAWFLICISKNKIQVEFRQGFYWSDLENLFEWFTVAFSFANSRNFVLRLVIFWVPTLLVIAATFQSPINAPPH